MPRFKLTEYQLAFMDTFGYLHLPGVLSDRIDRVDAAFEALMTSRGGAEHDGSGRFCVVPGLNHNAYLCTLLDDDRIDGLATSLLGDDYQYWNSDCNYYAGNTDYSTRDVFGAPGGPLLGTATPKRLRHLEQLVENIPAAAEA